MFGNAKRTEAKSESVIFVLLKTENPKNLQRECLYSNTGLFKITWIGMKIAFWKLTNIRQNFKMMVPGTYFYIFADNWV